MNQPRETAQDRPPTATLVATLVSYLLSPLLLPVLGFILVAHYRAATPLETTWVAMAGLAFYMVVPLAMLVVLIRRGVIETVEVRSRERRTLPFLLGMASMSAGAIAFWLIGTEAARLVALLAVISTVSAGMLTAITLVWKISIHASAAGAFFGLTLFFVILPGAVLDTRITPEVAMAASALIMPLVAWARVHLEAHTVRQVVAGSVFGFIMSTGPLYLIFG